MVRPEESDTTSPGRSESSLPQSSPGLNTTFNTTTDFDTDAELRKYWDAGADVKDPTDYSPNFFSNKLVNKI